MTTPTTPSLIKTVSPISSFGSSGHRLRIWRIDSFTSPLWRSGSNQAEPQGDHAACWTDVVRFEGKTERCETVSRMNRRGSPTSRSVITTSIEVNIPALAISLGVLPIAVVGNLAYGTVVTRAPVVQERTTLPLRSNEKPEHRNSPEL